MSIDKKSVFCKFVEIEITAFRTNQIAEANLKILNGSSIADTELLSVAHLECLEIAYDIPDQFIPKDIILASFSFCRWFLFDSCKPPFIMEFENHKLMQDKNSLHLHAIIFSKLHFLELVLAAGNAGAIIVEHKFFTDDDCNETQYTHSIVLTDNVSASSLIESYTETWPDATLLGVGSRFRSDFIEVDNDEKTNMIIEEIGKPHGHFAKQIVKRNSKVCP